MHCDSCLVILSYSLNLVLFNFHMLTTCLSLRIMNNSNVATLILQIKAIAVGGLFKHMLTFPLLILISNHDHDF